MTTACPQAHVVGVYRAARRSGRLGFVTTATETLTLDHAGIVGDRHSGPQRRAGPRERWLPRGASLRNDRQVSALCPAELAEIARRLGLTELPPEWIGGNLLIEGLPEFSRIAPGSRLAFGGGWCGEGTFGGSAVLRVEGYNFPCRLAGAGIAAASGEAGHASAFVKAALSLRGLVLSVDLAGTIAPGDRVVVIAPLVPPAG